MPDLTNIVTIAVRIRDEASASAGKIASAVRGIGTATSSANAAGGNLAANLLGVAGGNILSSMLSKGVDLAKGAADAARQAEAASDRLGVALGGNAAQLQSAQAAVADVGRSSVYGSAELTSTAEQLLERGVTADKLSQALRVVADTASALHQPLATVANQVAMTFDGIPGRLGRIVPGLKNLTAAELEAGRGLDVLAERYSGRAQAFADTDTGKEAAALRDIAQAYQEIGRAILPLERAVLPQFAKLASEAADYIASQLGLVRVMRGRERCQLT